MATLLLKSELNLRLFFIGCFILSWIRNLSNFSRPAHSPIIVTQAECGHLDLAYCPVLQMDAMKISSYLCVATLALISPIFAQSIEDKIAGVVPIISEPR
jgi:hypothetical protein